MTNERPTSISSVLTPKSVKQATRNSRHNRNVRPDPVCSIGDREQNFRIMGTSWQRAAIISQPHTNRVDVVEWDAGGGGGGPQSLSGVWSVVRLRPPRTHLHLAVLLSSHARPPRLLQLAGLGPLTLETSAPLVIFLPSSLAHFIMKCFI